MSSRFNAWHLGQLVAIVVMCAAFLAVVPYLGSDPIAEVSPQVSAQMPHGCPAVFTNHGQYSCFWQGPLRAHRIRFVSLVAALLAAWAFLIATSLTGRGFRLRMAKYRWQPKSSKHE
jgi:hypothetical protein